ncbi:unnamed protein product [Zymoseptoria tritici ST99CH_1A5]|uniref:Uncharacterized protein n=1 Tax=Zymoseptoria tritici ST99CH_1A5 TaxID=1276529 RepID=A0A1Y6M128_ZYMTR|nr:unnamed protein product [Zymoseptoria tritici ST99CH_1A5]
MFEASTSSFGKLNPPIFPSFKPVVLQRTDELEAQGDTICLLDELELVLDPSSKSAKSADSGAVTKSTETQITGTSTQAAQHADILLLALAPPTSFKATIEGPSTCIERATLLTDRLLSTFSKYTADKPSRLCTPYPSPGAQLRTRQTPDTLAPNVYQRLSVRSKGAADRIRPAPSLRSF